MNENEFAAPLSRVQQHLGKLDNDTMRELREKYIRVNPDFWRKMCNLILERCKFKPKRAHFHEAYKSAQETWSEPSREKCLECKGLRFVEDYYRVKRTGAVYHGVKPCPWCNPYKPRPNYFQDEKEPISMEKYKKLYRAKLKLIHADDPTQQPARGRRTKETRHISRVLPKARVFGPKRRS